MASKIKVNLDTSREEHIVRVCKQNDDLTLEALIYDDSVPKDLTNTEIAINCTRSDGKYTILNGPNVAKANNKITATLTQEFTKVSGEAKIDITLTDGAQTPDTAKQNTTFDVILDVRALVIEGAVQDSDNTVTIIQQLQDAVTQAGTKSTELTTATQQAETKRAEVVEATNQANTSKQQLDQSKQQADASKQALDTSKTNADASKVALDASNATATQTKTDLDNSNATATNTKNELDTSNATATQTKTDLTALNGTATTTKNELTTINQTATTTHGDLNTLNTTATQTNQTLTQTNNNANQTDTTLKGTIATAEQRKQELDQSIANAQNVVGGAELETYDRSGVDSTSEKVRIKHNGVYKIPVTQSDSVFLSDGTKALTTWINEWEAKVNNKVDKDGAKQLSTQDYSTEDQTTVGQARMFLDSGGTVNGIINATGLQIGGVPIIAESSDANGRYVKYYDGTLICYNSVSFGTSPFNTQSANSVWTSPDSSRGFTFPHVFVGNPIVTTNAISTGYLNSVAVGVSTSSFTMRIWSNYQSTQDGCVASYVAIGRWK